MTVLVFVFLCVCGVIIFSICYFVVWAIYRMLALILTGMAWLLIPEPNIKLTETQTRAQFMAEFRQSSLYLTAEQMETGAGEGMLRNIMGHRK